MDFNKDYYSILGVEKNAKKDEITSAYRKLMLKWHPDRFASKSKDEQEEATRKSAEINEAYDVLSDGDKRKEYDFMRENGGRVHNNAGFGGMGGFGFGGMGGFGFGGFNPWANDDIGGFGNADAFSTFRRKSQERNPRKGNSINIQVELPFEDFFFGCKKTVDIKVKAKCQNCRNGVVGDSPEYDKCPNCNGTGVLLSHGNGMQVMETCRNCGGTGQILKNACPHCNGTSIDGIRVQTVEFIIPKDTRDFYSQTYENIGHAGIFGGESGDITISARMGDSGMFFSLGGNDLGTIHFVNIFKAISGGYETVMTPYGRKTIMIPSEMEDGHEIRFNGMGLKSRNSDESDGSLTITFKYDFPKGLSKSIMDEVSKISDNVENNASCFRNVSMERSYSEEYMKRLNQSGG